MSRDLKPGECAVCHNVYTTEPALAVACPTCGAAAGSPCVSRAPSGHVKTGAFQGLPPWGHDARELAAAAAGAYYLCTPGVCDRPAAAPLDLFTMEESNG